MTKEGNEEDNRGQNDEGRKTIRTTRRQIKDKLRRGNGKRTTGQHEGNMPREEPEENRNK